MSIDVIGQKDGYVIRLAKANDAVDYYKQNYCPLDKEVARLRDAIMDGDKYADDILMSILEDEWRTLKAQR